MAVEADEPEWDEAQDEAELEKLRAEPSGHFPQLPPEVLAYELPVSGLYWTDFEALCDGLHGMTAARWAPDATAGAARNSTASTFTLSV